MKLNSENKKLLNTEDIFYSCDNGELEKIVMPNSDEKQLLVSKQVQLKYILNNKNIFLRSAHQQVHKTGKQI